MRECRRSPSRKATSKANTVPLKHYRRHHGENEAVSIALSPLRVLIFLTGTKADQTYPEVRHSPKEKENKEEI